MLNKIFMFFVLILLVNYNVTEEMMHEWLAVAFVIAGSLHLFRQRWWLGMKGKFSLNSLRIKSTFTSLLIISLVLTLVSGVLISQHVFPIFRMKENLAEIQTFHHIAGLSAFVLCYLHFGMHWAAAKRFCRRNPSLTVCGLISAGIASIAGILNADYIESFLWDVSPTMAMQEVFMQSLLLAFFIVAAVSVAFYGFFINQIRI